MLKRLLTILSCLTIAVGFAGCTVDQTEEGEMPIIETERRTLPDYDAAPANRQIEQEDRTITVPDIDVEPREEYTPPAPEVDTDFRD